MKSYLPSMAGLLLLPIAHASFADPQPEWAERLGVTVSPLNPAFVKYQLAQSSTSKAQSFAKSDDGGHALGYVPPPYVFPANMRPSLGANAAKMGRIWLGWMLHMRV